METKAEKEEETDEIKEAPEEEAHENKKAENAKGFGKIKKMFTGTTASLIDKTSGKN